MGSGGSTRFGRVEIEQDQNHCTITYILCFSSMQVNLWNFYCTCSRGSWVSTRRRASRCRNASRHVPIRAEAIRVTKALPESSSCFTTSHPLLSLSLFSGRLFQSLAPSPPRPTFCSLLVLPTDKSMHSTLRAVRNAAKRPGRSTLASLNESMSLCSIGGRKFSSSAAPRSRLVTCSTARIPQRFSANAHRQIHSSAGMLQSPGLKTVYTNELASKAARILDSTCCGNWVRRSHVYRGSVICGVNERRYRIKLHFKDSKGNLIKTVEGNEGDDILSLAHEYDIDLEGEFPSTHKYLTSYLRIGLCSQGLAKGP